MSLLAQHQLIGVFLVYLRAQKALKMRNYTLYLYLYFGYIDCCGRKRRLMSVEGGRVISKVSVEQPSA